MKSPPSCPAICAFKNTPTKTDGTEAQGLKAIWGRPMRQQKERSSMERRLIIGINSCTFTF